jgi:hypothetical protein
MSCGSLIIYPWHLIIPACVLHRHLRHGLSHFVRHLPNEYARIQVLPKGREAVLVITVNNVRYIVTCIQGYLPVRDPIFCGMLSPTLPVSPVVILRIRIIGTHFSVYTSGICVISVSGSSICNDRSEGSFLYFEVENSLFCAVFSSIWMFIELRDMNKR